MSQQYAYNLAYIDPETNMCLEVFSTTNPNAINQDNVVEIEVCDEEYLFKYYNWDDGKFYYDPEYTQEYISPLL